MNKVESKVASFLRKDGWKVIRTGWPDFLCCKTGECLAVEVKYRSALTVSQKKMHRVLESFGIPVLVHYVDPGKLLVLRFAKRDMKRLRSRAEISKVSVERLVLRILRKRLSRIENHKGAKKNG